MALNLSLAAQTAFAQLAEVLVASEPIRSVADLPGAFTCKRVKGHTYWYYQYSEPNGTRRQTFVGPDNDSVKAVVAKAAMGKATGDVAAFVRAAVAHGCAEVLPRHFKVLRRLAEYGFFRAGGVLIGTHAFIAYGNMLGVRWTAADVAKTQDIDFAHAGRNVSLLLAAEQRVDVHSAIESLEMGFLPVATMAGKTGGAYLIPDEKDFRLDFLTTVGRDGEVPYRHPALGVTLQPLRFMEYSLENIQQSVLLSGDSAVLVNVPHPARYALHKLIVAGIREGVFASKSGKDIQQSALLLRVLRELRPWEVEEAWADLIGRGTGWQTRAMRGLGMLDRQFPEDGFAQWLSH